MPVVHIDWWEGKPDSVRKKVLEGVVQAFTAAGLPKESVQVIIHDVPKKNWVDRGELCGE